MLSDTLPVSEITQSIPQTPEKQGEVDIHTEKVADPLQVTSSSPHSQSAVGRSITTPMSIMKTLSEAKASVETPASIQTLNTSLATNRRLPSHQGGRARQPTKQKADSEAIEGVSKQGRLQKA